MANEAKDQIRLVLTGTAGPVKKKNGSGREYVQFPAVVDKGQAGEGLSTIATFTLGKGKIMPEKGETVNSYHRAEPSNSGEGYIHFFEIGSANAAIDNNALTAALGVTSDINQEL